MSASAKLTIRVSCLRGSAVLFVSGETAVVQLYPPSLSNMDRSICGEVVHLARNHVEVRYRTRQYQRRVVSTFLKISEGDMRTSRKMVIASNYWRGVVSDNSEVIWKTRYVLVQMT